MSATTDQSSATPKVVSKPRKRATRSIKKPTTRFSRESLPEIVKALQAANDSSSRAWNIVEVLELLIDAGHFLTARGLSQRVVRMLEGDGRERLFKGYEALCVLMSEGSAEECVARLEQLYIEIHNSGHSVADKVRIGLLLSRALAMCVGGGALPAAGILRARSVLAVELERAAGSAEVELHGQVALELAKAYLHAPISDALAAHSILERVSKELNNRGISPGLAFDITRVMYQSGRILGVASDTKAQEHDLRQQATANGVVAQALAELAIARRAEEINSAALEGAVATFEVHEFLSGAFEGLFLLATSALDRGHNVVAERFLLRAQQVAERAGFEQGVALAQIGLFQGASIADDRRAMQEHCRRLTSGTPSELVLCASGVNMAAAQQITGDFAGAIRTATRCQKFFEGHGLWSSASQALFIVGTCQAQLGKWGKAAVAWNKAYVLDRKRNACIQACERQCMVVQALVMDDMLSRGGVRPATASKSHKQLREADALLRSCGDSVDGVRARARLLQIEAQLCVMTGSFVASLKHLSNSRGLFDSLGMEFEVAMVDAFTGLSLMEVGKGSAPDVLEEAVHTLQRAYQFFSSPVYPPIRWKLSYYLAMAALHISNNAGDPFVKAKWRDLAVGWTRSADHDLELLAKNTTAPLESLEGASDFSPGLRPAAMEALKRALGVKVRGGEKGDQVVTEKMVAPDSGPVH